MGKDLSKHTEYTKATEGQELTQEEQERVQVPHKEETVEKDKNDRTATKKQKKDFGKKNKKTDEKELPKQQKPGRARALIYTRSHQIPKPDLEAFVDTRRKQKHLEDPLRKIH